jgi:hypothetical protein
MEKAIRNIVIYSATFLVLSFASLKGYSQTNFLEKVISISVSNETVEKVLSKISKKVEANFSYNSDLIPLDSVVSMNVNNVRTSKALSVLLGKNYYFKTLGNHIIILKRNVINVENPKKTTCTITGFVYNSLTNEKISNTSIFDLNKNFSVLTDSNGFYKLTFMPEKAFIGLGFCKSSFNDTVVFVKATTSTIDIRLNPNARKIEHFEKIQTKKANEIPQFNINEYKIVQTFVKADMLAHAKNIDIQEKRTAQFSILPYIGTNRNISGAIVNRISFNAIAGYSSGVEGAELGTLLNISKNDVKGFQFSGFGNITGGNTKGFQAAGFFNRNIGNVSGVQMSGFSNIVLDTLKGVQLGCVNYVKTNKGFQLGIINMADSSYGVSIGFLSIVKKGYYNLSLFTDEMLMANLTFKMGTHKFYNIWGLSANKEMWGLTYGVGIHRHPEKKLSFNYDLSVTNMSYKKTFETQVCLKTKLSADINYRLSPKIEVFTGLAYNVFTSDKINDTALQNYVSEITITKTYSTTFKSVTLQHWPGFEFGFKWRL